MTYANGCRNSQITEITTNFIGLVLKAPEIFLQASKRFEKFLYNIFISFLNYGLSRTANPSAIADNRLRIAYYKKTLLTCTIYCTDFASGLSAIAN